MTEFWSWWIIVLVVINVAGCWGLLHWTRNMKESEDQKTTGHVYDGIEEYNNPLPRWWLNMFYITLVFTLVYLMLYPGLGSVTGSLNWSQEGQHADEVKAAKASYQPLFEKYAATPIAELARIKQATEMGKRIFVNTCAACHGSDAGGAPGFPNLTDNDWLYGGSAEQIKQSVTLGRQGMMPALGTMLNDQQVEALVNYVASLSGEQVDVAQSAEGKVLFEGAGTCFGCHGVDGKGNIAMGAPNLTDKIWLYGGSKAAITQTIKNGRNGKMPAHQSLLDEAKIHLVTAYIYSLSNQ